MDSLNAYSDLMQTGRGYVPPEIIEPGTMAFVNSFEELKLKKLKPNSKFCFWQVPAENVPDLVYVVMTDEKGTKKIQTYELKETANPEPVTQPQIQQQIIGLEQRMDAKLQALENQITGFMQLAAKFVEDRKGTNNDAISVSEQQQPRATTA